MGVNSSSLIPANESRSIAAHITTSANAGPSIPTDVLCLCIIVSILSCMATCGNILVIYAIVTVPNLRSVTNVLISSLATADLTVGSFVMPLDVYNSLSLGYWALTSPVCDIWHSVDILASTASIWSLCVISVDRLLAVRDPFTYPELMSYRRAGLAVASVWMSASVISFPGIAWWRMDSPHLYINATACEFTDSLAYLTFSSLVSFYVPLFIMIFAYWRVYAAAITYERGLRTGNRSTQMGGGDGPLTMRIHRGKSTDPAGSPLSLLTSASSVSTTPRGSPSINMSTAILQSPASNSQSRRSYGVSGITTINLAMIYEPLHKKTDENRKKDVQFRKKLKLRLSRFAREKKAAKTLGIVVGCFIFCWLPFFIVNVLLGLCPDCVDSPDLVFSLVTTLGYCNSALNPLIYAFHSNDFRTAFKNILLKRCCYNSKTGALPHSQSQGPYQRKTTLWSNGRAPTTLSGHFPNSSPEISSGSQDQSTSSFARAQHNGSSL